MRKKSLLFNLIAIASLFLFVFSLAGKVSAKNAGEDVAGLDYNPRAEHWVLIKLYQGQEADLITRFPNPEDRRIRGSFLVKTLDNPTDAISLHGIHISNATIVGDFSYKDREVDFPVYIIWSTFEGKVELCNSHFHKYLSLQGGIFKSKADFCGLKVDDSVCLAGAVFYDSMTLGNAEIRESLVFSSARFDNKEQEASFGGITVGKGISLEGAIFEGKVNFNYANIGDGLGLADAQFNNKENEASFGSITVGDSISFERAIFEGGVNLNFANIGLGLGLEEVQFRNHDIVVQLQEAEVGHQIDLEKAIFLGGASFRSTYASYLNLDDAVFQNNEQLVNFEDISTETIFLRGTIFHGQVNFNNSYFERYFYGSEAQFLNVENRPSFVNMYVGYSLLLDSAVFNGGADFNYTSVGHDFSLYKSKFNNPDVDSDFQYISVGGNLNFSEANIKGPIFLGHSKIGRLALLNNATFDKYLDFRYGSIGRNFEANDTKFDEIFFQNLAVIDHILINRTKFAGNADFSFVETGGNFEAIDTEFKGEVYFNDMKIEKNFLIDKAVFLNVVQFIRTSTNMLSGIDTSFPDEEDKVEIYALEYDTVYFKLAETEEGFISLLDKSTFYENDYKKLQEYYIKSGYPIAAEQVYVQYKFREATKNLYPWHWRWWWSWFLAVFIAFGKGPDIALFWFFLIVMFGWFMFRKKEKMTASAETSKAYRPLFYSLDLFLPLVNLGYADVWHPNPENKILKIYSVIHRYLGLILIPIAILAFLGIIK